ncbi:MAG: CoA-binding protein [Thermodesulfobacteriota bacterium]
MDLKPLFEPRTMAVFGVSSSNYRHPANEIFTKNLLRYPVKVYGVNPRGGTVNGQAIHRSISEIPEPIDLAVIAVRADFVPDVLSECIRAKTRSATVISGGVCGGRQAGPAAANRRDRAGGFVPLCRTQLSRDLRPLSCGHLLPAGRTHGEAHRRERILRKPERGHPRGPSDQVRR